MHAQTCSRCDDLACCVWWRTTRVCSSCNTGAYAFYHPDADVLNAGRPTVSDSANASASECDSRIDRQARVPQTLSRHHRSFAADARSTAYGVITGPINLRIVP